MFGLVSNQNTNHTYHARKWNHKHSSWWGVFDILLLFGHL